MDDFESLSHSKWECKYHVVFIPKYRRRVLYGQLRSHLGEVFHRLARQKESRIEEGHLMSDHVHMLISIPPKYAVCQVIGFIKGKSAIHLTRVYGERQFAVRRASDPEHAADRQSARPDLGGSTRTGVLRAHRGAASARRLGSAPRRRRTPADCARRDPVPLLRVDPLRALLDAHAE